ncbi:DUF2397 domain-containing protein [Rhodococcus sp. CH91]|uniref:DUF2397 domain-containing protein n=1 Tax=Rhodococcus sp. CH91 TaxID=2910256 RepID=UPI001F4A57C0|nr:DUF2397 domain-containing protein [Rhodococcus sp. CH91]
MGEHTGRDLFRYLVAEESDDYLAVMDCFTDALLTDLSAADIAALCTARDAQAGTARDVLLDVSVVETRCRRLAGWGNLARVGGGESRSDLAAPARYRATPAGLRVHRESVRLLTTSDGVREVARESLRCIAAELGRLGDRLAVTVAPLDPDDLAEGVTTLFTHHRAFTDSVDDFCSHLAEILDGLERSDSGGDHAELERVLLDYVDVVGSDVARYAPLVVSRLGRVVPHLDTVLAALPESGLRAAVPVRSPGRSRDDWEELARWYDENSGPRRMRETAATALNRLLARTRRLASGAPACSQRADLLRLARWFAESSDEQAHRLFTATFGAYPSRHLLLGPEEADPRIGAGTSWWHADPVTVPLSLRERGDRSSRGRVARLPDSGPDRARAEELARHESRRRADAVAELCAAGELNGAHLSEGARDVLLDVLATALAGYRSTDGPLQMHDPDLGLSLTAEPGRDTLVHCPDGDLTVHAFVVRASATTSPEHGVVVP